jgi:hypothetical protein
MSILQKLTEGVQSRDMQAEGAALLNKWEATGLLEGLDPGQAKQTMAVLLENQAKELLREASSMAAGDVEGFAAVAFPIVRRVFGGLIANELVSVQPMSLPSGLIFFLDFTHTTARFGAEAGESLYGGNVVAKELVDGVNLGDAAGGPGGHYDLGVGYSSPTGSTTAAANPVCVVEGRLTGSSAIRTLLEKELRFDPDCLSDTDSFYEVVTVDKPADIDSGMLGAVSASHGATALAQQIKRLTDVTSAGKLKVVFKNSVAMSVLAAIPMEFPTKDDLSEVSAGVGAVVGAAPWGLEEPTPAGIGDGNVKDTEAGTYQSIPEIDIKVDSIAVTAQTKKLKAKWTPELGQDLNAYHNLDAEVELTGILSEQIALEIDRELLGELVSGATAGTRYWSRAPGLFVNSAGTEIGASSAAPDFTGTVSEWYETLIETINDVSAQIHRKTLRGGANFVVCSPEVANILEFTSGFRASVTADQDRGTIGAVKSGSLSKKFDVYVDPYFLRNVILIGRKGSSFLESGFVYAPYVPLQVTPTIFGTEDFVPRKGVMTRYAKKMVRPDMYGLVVVRGLLGEAGATS